MIKKNIPRLLINKELKLNKKLELNLNDKHYLRKVLRLNNGDKVNVFNGFDGEWETVVDNLKDFALICKKKIKSMIFRKK